jgi:hypothetical protein
MPQNSEIAEQPKHAERGAERVFSQMAADLWNQKDMRTLAENKQNCGALAEFGHLELFDETSATCSKTDAPPIQAKTPQEQIPQEQPPRSGQEQQAQVENPPLIARVDATLDRKTGTLTVTEVDGNAQHKKGESVSIHANTGNLQYGAGYPGGEGADCRYDSVTDHGPIPKGKYLIGNRYTNEDVARDHPGGDADWYKLYGNDGKGGYNYEHMWNSRGVFNLHTGNRSNGCVSVPSDVQESDPVYPRSTEFDKVKGFLNPSKPFEYKGSTFKGVLHVE